MTRFIVSIAAMLALVALGILYEGGRIILFIAPVPFLLVLLLPMIAVFAAWGFGGIRRAFGNALGKIGAPGQLEESLLFWDTWEKTCYAAGVVGFLTGAIMVFSNLSIPAIGQPLAMSLFSLIYSAFLGVLSRIMRARVEERGDTVKG
jgi:flagellar motor component MotA